MKAARISLVALSVLMAILLASCAAPAAGPDGVGQQISAPGGNYTLVSVAELQPMLASKDFTFVNVHIPFEGDIAGTDVSIPYDQIETQLDQLPAKDAKIVLYCRSGRMSKIAAEKLVELGYTNVTDVEGGMQAWEAVGLPIKR